MSTATSYTQFDPFDPAIRADPYPMYAEVRENAPCVYIERHGFWYISRYADAARALHDWETFSSRRGSMMVPIDNPTDAGVLASSDPPDHDRIRGVVADDFKPRKIATVEPRVRELTIALLGTALERGEVDWVEHLCQPLPTTVMAEMLGFPDHHRDEYCLWADKILATMGPVTSEGADAGDKAWQEYYGFLQNIDAKQEYLAGGWGERVCQAARTGVLTHEESLSVLGAILVGAMDTTVNLLGNLANTFADQPEVFARLRKERQHCASAVEESLRYEAPVQPGLFRQTLRDAEIASVTIPANSRVMVGWGAANRDPRQFPDPDDFMIDRTPNPHLSFGRGKHFCIGAPVARIIARVVVEELADRVRAIEPAGESVRKDNPVVRGLDNLPVRLVPA